MTGATVATASAQLAIVTRPLALAVSVFVFLIAVAALAWALRARRLAVASARRGPVWGCGYLFPSPKMQYTASSFAQPLTTQFHLLIRNREALVPPQGYFPAASSYASDSGDPALRLLFVPTFRWFDRVAIRLNVIQHGHIHVYILYVAATLIALLIWESL
jgi:hypothetical protein